MKVSHRTTLATKRKIRVRKHMHGTALRPRLSVFRSVNHLYLQAIDDDAGKTLVACNDLQVDAKKVVNGKKKSEVAPILAEMIAHKMKSAKIKQIVFDRGSYRYHGRVKAIAETLRSQGIQF